MIHLFKLYSRQLRIQFLRMLGISVFLVVAKGVYFKFQGMQDYPFGDFVFVSYSFLFLFIASLGGVQLSSPWINSLPYSKKTRMSVEWCLRFFKIASALIVFFFTIWIDAQIVDSFLPGAKPTSITWDFFQGSNKWKSEFGLLSTTWFQIFLTCGGVFLGLHYFFGAIGHRQIQSFPAQVATKRSAKSVLSQWIRTPSGQLVATGLVYYWMYQLELTSPLLGCIFWFYWFSFAATQAWSLRFDLNSRQRRKLLAVTCLLTAAFLGVVFFQAKVDALSQNRRDQIEAILFLDSYAPRLTTENFAALLAEKIPIDDQNALLKLYSREYNGGKSIALPIDSQLIDFQTLLQKQTDREVLFRALAEFDLKSLKFDNLVSILKRAEEISPRMTFDDG